MREPPLRELLRHDERNHSHRQHRHPDRGTGEPVRDQFNRLQYVFGASGAAALYRRPMLEEVSLGGEYFDEDFFTYREDADLAWRAQLLGWKALYVPHAVASHERKVLPERRRSLPDVFNMHSVKNRFLLRIKNQTCWSSWPFSRPPFGELSRSLGM